VKGACKTDFFAVISIRKSFIGMAIAGVIAIAARLAALIPAVVTKAFVEVEIAIFHEICDFI